MDGLSPAPDRYGHCAAVTPHDSNNHTDGEAQALYIGGAGNVTLVRPDGTAVLFTAPPVGTVLRVENVRVNATGTTATAMVALYYRKGSR